MNPPPPTQPADDTPERVLGPDDGRAYRRFVEWSEDGGFRLAIASIDHPADIRDLVEWTRARTPGAVTVALDGAPPIVSRIEEACVAAAPSMLFLTRLEESADRVRACRELNVGRDEFRKRWPISWVVLAHSSAVLDLERDAPDFCDVAGLWVRSVRVFEVPKLLARASFPLPAFSIRLPTEGRRGEVLKRAAKALSMGRFDEVNDSLAEYDLAVGNGPIAPERYLLGGQFEIARGRYDEALLLLRLCIAVSPDDVTRGVAWQEIAYIRRLRGEPDEALRILRQEVLTAFHRADDTPRMASAITAIADILLWRGELAEALRNYRDVALPIMERLGSERDVALVKSRIAVVLLERGELDEALRIFRDRVLPVYDRIGDVRSRAATLGRIADVLQARGEYDEALRIWSEEELPIYERLGDVRQRALTLGRIADVRQARGEFGEALRMRQDLLSTYERLGEVRERAATVGKMADIQAERGELTEALRLRREEELPVYERLGYRRDRLIAQANIAYLLLRRAQPGDREEAARLLTDAVREAATLHLPETEQMRGLCRRYGLDHEPSR